MLQALEMNKAIQEYYAIKSCNPSRNSSGVSNKELHELLLAMHQEHDRHLREQDLLLQIIQNQSKPNFPREFLANVSANAAWDGLLFVGSKLIKGIKL